MISVSPVEIEPWKLPSIRRVPANSSSPVTLVPLSRNPETVSDPLGRNFMRAPSESPRLSELSPKKALVHTILFLKRKEMNLDFSLTAALVNRNFRTQDLLESVNCSLNVR